MILNLPNILSLARIPLALLFLQESVITRLFAIILAMMTDWLDGFLARRYSQTSKAGRLIDPITDKFFVCFILAIFVKEGQIKAFQALTFFTRDLSVFIFGFYLLLTEKIKKYSYAPFWIGKITTTLQFFLLLALTLKIQIPPFFFQLLISLGFLSFIELFFKEKMIKSTIY